MSEKGKCELSSYAFREHGGDARLYNGIFDLEAENERLRGALEEVDATLCECRYSSDHATAVECNCDVHAAHRIIAKITAEKPEAPATFCDHEEKCDCPKPPGACSECDGIGFTAGRGPDGEPDGAPCPVCTGSATGCDDDGSPLMASLAAMAPETLRKYVPEAPPSEERVDPLDVVLQLRQELAAANERADKNARLLLEAISLSDMRRKTLFDKSNEFRDEWKRAEEAEAQRDAARQDLASAVEVLRDFTPGLGKLGPWDRWERARTLIARFDAQGDGR